jgi:hypothetical protein
MQSKKARIYMATGRRGKAYREWIADSETDRGNL